MAVKLEAYPRTRTPNRAGVVVQVFKSRPGLRPIFESAESVAQWKEFEDRRIRIEPLSPNIAVRVDEGEEQQVAFFDPYDRLPLEIHIIGWSRHFEVAATDGANLEVTLPALMFDGHRLDIPPVKFTQAETVFLSPINC
jgi:hypothetical protein